MSIITIKLAMVSNASLAKAFTEWERRYRKEPDRFMSESEKAAESAETYGEGAAEYLLQIIAEQDNDREAQ
ncbi:MAG TPA: hypothetical protein VF450_08845 [Noviherbaspirillum sp.]